jgi:hypothetical protein
MGVIGGEEPTRMVPNASNPWLRYSETFLGLVDSK